MQRELPPPPFDLGEIIYPDDWRIGQMYYIYDKIRNSYHKIRIYRVLESPDSPRDIWIYVGNDSGYRDGPFGINLDAYPDKSSLIMYRIDSRPLRRAVANSFLTSAAVANAKSKYGNNWRRHVMYPGVGISANPNAGPLGTILNFLTTAETGKLRPNSRHPKAHTISKRKYNSKDKKTKKKSRKI